MSENRVRVELTAFEWHIILKMLENELNSLNAERFSGVSHKVAKALYVKIAEQLSEKPERLDYERE